ncbi:lipid transporter [Populus alba x Populus x berolinensis]|nr:lipid transporter [Populus alba x Populus x berolinensis]
MTFGPSYSYSLIRMLYGRKWSDGEASTALQYYCFYVIVLAMNGTSEAFLHAVATESQLKRSNDSLLVFSLIYVVMNVLLIKSAGAVGLILANSLNMILRIIYSAVFIKYYFQDSSAFSFTSCLPSGWTVLLFSGVITLISEKLFLDHENFWPTFLIHFSIGLTCFCISSFIITKNTRVRMNYTLLKSIPCYGGIISSKDYWIPNREQWNTLAPQFGQELRDSVELLVLSYEDHFQNNNTLHR